MYLLLFLFFIILTGKVTIEILVSGLVLTAALGGLLYALFGYTPGRELRFLKKAPLFFLYLFVLLFEILKASGRMIGCIFAEKSGIRPVLVTFESGLKTRFGRYVLANSITLTPGTITVEQTGDVFTVHCLKREFLDVSEDSVMMRWIRRLER